LPGLFAALIGASVLWQLFEMEGGRLIRTRLNGMAGQITYIVAVSDAQAAIDVIRRDATHPDVEIEDLGRVSSALVTAMKLQPGQYMRADQYQKRGYDLG
jgi:hypothetical protein